MNSPSATTRTKLNIQQMALVGLMTALLCILAPFSLPLPISPIPVSLGTLVVYFAVIILGCKLGTLSVILYLLLGLAGLPVFSGFTGGAGKLLGPTGGYLIGYIFLAVICGYFIQKSSNRAVFTVLSMILGTLVCYLFGTLWLAYQSEIGFTTALATAVLPFLPGDIIKIALALLLGRQTRKRLVIAGFFYKL